MYFTFNIVVVCSAGLCPPACQPCTFHDQATGTLVHSMQRICHPAVSLLLLAPCTTTSDDGTTHALAWCEDVMYVGTHPLFSDCWF
jgi:hypothetical protein